eukprot:GHVR01173299.1.p1 GENE.GHVR01173299.1~~GHVR01173299.1.p1  ORF type:complete len:102 (+),score=2.28 GHVR01173299.1:1059-1364(+)
MHFTEKLHIIGDEIFFRMSIGNRCSNGTGNKVAEVQKLVSYKGCDTCKDKVLSIFAFICVSCLSCWSLLFELDTIVLCLSVLFLLYVFIYETRVFSVCDLL